MQHSNGVIFYQGPSELDGKPIIAIATGLKRPSANPKTGPMIQTYILRADMPPLEAIKYGADESICGDCKHRGLGNGKQRSCYVYAGQGPTQVYKAYKRGSYPERLRSGDFAGKTVRLGAYGDPAAVPADVWREVLAYAKGWTGYTHQWADATHLKRWVMASCDTTAERYRAKVAGWRTFRVFDADGWKADYAHQGLARELVCPASVMDNVQCNQCLRCNGKTSKLADVCILVHGSGASNFAKNLHK